MLLLALLVFTPVALCRNITDEENRYLKNHCGDHFLNGSGREVPDRIKRSLGGIKAKQNEFPWIVGIFLRKAYYPPPYRIWAMGCSGVQISSRHILTAAHCTVKVSPYLKLFCRRRNMKDHRIKYTVQEPSLFKVFVGSGCTNPELCKHNRTNYSVIDVTVHQEYNPCDLENDLAILELDRNISHLHGSPICMPKSGKTPTAAFLTAVGFGIDPKSPPKHPGLLDDLRYVNLGHAQTEGTKYITTASTTNSICPGDSGGPLTHNSMGRNYTVEGIASSSYPPCYASVVQLRSSYFVNVREYLNWICGYTGVCPTSKEDEDEEEFVDVPPFNISELEKELGRT